MSNESLTGPPYRREDIPALRTKVARSRRRCHRHFESTLGRALPFAWREFIDEHPGRSLLFALSFGTAVGLGRRTWGRNSYALRAWQTIQHCAVPRIQTELRQFVAELRRRRRREEQTTGSATE